MAKNFAVFCTCSLVASLVAVALAQSATALDTCRQVRNGPNTVYPTKMDCEKLEMPEPEGRIGWEPVKNVSTKFVASKTGTLKANASNTQVFKTPGGEIACTGLTMSGVMPTTNAYVITVKAKYSGCTAFGFLSATVTEGEYELVPEGWVDVAGPAIVITPAGAGCSVKIPATIANAGRKTVKYSGTTSVKIEFAAQNVTVESSGGLCGASGSSGTYSGAAILELEGGTLEWQ